MAKISGSQLGATLGGGAGAALGSLGGPGGTALGMQLGTTFGGMIGGLFDEGPDVQAYLDQMAALYDGIVAPDLAKAIVYAQYKQGGTLTPQQLSQLPVEVQEAVQLRESPEFKQKQKAQLQQLEQLSRTGMGPQEMLALEKSRQAAAADAQSRLKSLMQQYQQMGQLGGGAAFAAQLSSAQAADQQEAMTNMQAAAMAAENRRNAIQQAFQAASGMRQQDLQVNQYNTENRRQKQMFDIQNAMTRQQQNAQYANQANIMNLQRQQQVADMNMQQLNQETYRQKFLAPQQMFSNQMALANAKAGVLAQKAGLAQQQAQMQSQANMNFMTGLSQAGMGFANMQQNDQLMQMYGAKEGLVKGSDGNWMKPPAAAPVVAPPPSVTALMVPPPSAPVGMQGFNFGNAPLMDSSQLSMPQVGGFNRNPYVMPQGTLFSPSGVGGFQAGSGYPVSSPYEGPRPFELWNPQPITSYWPYGTGT
jgi:hypothetical protein